jgi:peptide/nickel transport system substrate-binding protein
MHDQEFSRRRFLKTVLAGSSVLAAPAGFLTLVSGAEAAAGQPVPPISMMYYGNWPEIVAQFRKGAEDFRKIGLTPKLNPAPSSVVVPKTLQQHAYGDWGSILWGATPERIDPNFYLEEMLGSKSKRNYGYYNNAKYDAAVRAQQEEMDPAKRAVLIKQTQAIAAADYPVWWLAHPAMISAYNQKLFGNVVEILGAGYGHMYSIWNYLNVTPKTSRRTLKAGMENEINTLNPFTAPTSPNQQFMRFFYDTFSVIGPDREPHPRAAESWKTVDAKTVDVKLRQGMKFHDGKPVTGDDISFTFDYLKKWQFPFFRAALSVIDKVDVNGYDIRFHLTRPYAPFFANVLSWLIILPKHIWQDIPEKVGVKNPGEYQNHQPIGSGPFIFGHWRKGQEIYFKANKDHYMAPKVDDVYLVIIPSVDGNAGALERGEIDMIQQTITPALGDQLSKNPDIKVGYAPSHGVYEVRPDLRKAPFSDVNFRKAIYHAWDRRPLINYFAGKAIMAGNTPITPVLKQWCNTDLVAPEYNIDKARAVLKDAGYTWNSSGELVMPG